MAVEKRHTVTINDSQARRQAAFEIDGLGSGVLVTVNPNVDLFEGKLHLLLNPDDVTQLAAALKVANGTATADDRAAVGDR